MRVEREAATVFVLQLKLLVIIPDVMLDLFCFFCDNAGSFCKFILGECDANDMNILYK
jgi:hypothetical protein